MSKVKISAINTGNRMFDTSAPDTDIKEIVYKREGNLYNKGFQTGVPGYVIKLHSTDRIILVPEHAVKEVYIDTQQEQEGDVIPDLPDADVTS